VDWGCPAIDRERQPLALGPGFQFRGLAAGFRPPLVVTVPELQIPVVETLEIPKQGHQGHGILAPRQGR